MEMKLDEFPGLSLMYTDIPHIDMIGASGAIEGDTIYGE